MSREIDLDIAGMDGEDMVDEIMELRRRVAELEADRDVYKDPGWIEQIASRARVEGLRIAQAMWDADGMIFTYRINKRIAALERGKEK